MTHKRILKALRKKLDREKHSNPKGYRKDEAELKRVLRRSNR